MRNIAVFASGRGTNFEAIVKAAKTGVFKADIALLVCDNEKAPVIDKAKKAKVKTLLIIRSDFPSRDAFEKAICDYLVKEKIELIVLAGFMRILGPYIIRRFKNRIINIHPALLPSFKGSHGIKDAFDYGVKATGVTVHFVDERMDHGPIILQEAVAISEKDTLESLEEKIHKVEHRIYPQAIKLFFQKGLCVKGRKVQGSP